MSTEDRSDDRRAERDPSTERERAKDTAAYATEHEYEVVVVGCGIAGLAAGLRAAELGRSVALLEKSSKANRGGQTAYSESFRVPSADTDLEDYGYEFAVSEYSTQDFYDDVMHRTNDRADPGLARTLVENAGNTIEWLTAHGVEWEMEPLAVGYTAGRTWFDNDSLLTHLVAEIIDLGGDVYYETAARRVVQDHRSRIVGLDAVSGNVRARFSTPTLVLACGGFESSPEKRARYMGAGYDDMKVRGSPHNTGGAIEMALDAGANAVGQWSGAHMALIDANAPDFGGGANRVDGYQYGVILDVEGKRFLDEGEDARAHTYAKFGRAIFERPDHRAYVVLDAKTHDLARATGPTDPIVADNVKELFASIEIDAERARETVGEFNDACEDGDSDGDGKSDGFDPHVLDGVRTTGLRPPKSNWALPIDDPPFYAYPVTGGITFSFGGVEITPDAEVCDTRGRVVPGFYAAGTSTGGLFYDNYPGGTGLTNAAVYGKIAAESADAYLADRGR